MNFKEHKKTYQERMEKLDNYTTRIPNMTVANYYQATFNSKMNNLKMTSNARIEDDILFLLPLHTNVSINKLDFLVILDYWTFLAKWKGLTSIQLSSRKVNENVVKKWNNVNEFLTMIEQIGFMKRNGKEYEILVEDVPDLIDTRMVITNLLNAIHENDLSFNFTDFYKSDPSAFYEVRFEWRGVSKNLLFYCHDKNYSFVYEGRNIPFTQKTIAGTIENILQKIEESVKLKNLLDPPFVNISKLLNTKCGLSKSIQTDTLAKNIMETFINLGFSYKQVEVEAVRLEESVGFTMGGHLLPYQESLFRFFDSHYLAIIHLSKFNLEFVLTEDIQDVITFHNEYLQKRVAKRFAEFQ